MTEETAVSRKNVDAALADLWDIIKPKEKIDENWTDEEATKMLTEASELLAAGDEILPGTKETLKALAITIVAGVTTRKEKSEMAASKKEAPVKKVAAEKPAKPVKEKKAPKEKKAKYTRFHAMIDVIRKGTTMENWAAAADELYVKAGNDSNIKESEKTMKLTKTILDAMDAINVASTGRMTLK